MKDLNVRKKTRRRQSRKDARKIENIPVTVQGRAACIETFMKKTTLTLFLVFILVPCFFYIRNWNKEAIDIKLKKISQYERKHLDLFFRSCFARDGLGYTLFGDKPMTVVGYSRPKSTSKNIDDFFDSIFSSFSSENLWRYCGWEIFHKYKDYFPITKYGIVKCKNFIENDYTAILFINKKNVLETITTHLADFKMVLGQKITPEKLLEKILHSDDVFGDTLKNHQGLIGTLLGYGRHNAWLFHRREELEPLIGLRRFSLKKIPEQTSKEELNSLNQKLQIFDDRGILDFNFLILSLPGFAADSDAGETKQLKVKYERQYRDIIHRFQEGDFLEITLKQLTLSD